MPTPLSRKLDDRLSALAAMERAGSPDLGVVRDALRSKTGALVAAAARLVARSALEPLFDELAPAFVRLCERPVERDPGCRGKIAVARALSDLDRFEEDVFVRGVSLVQHEPVWGGREDTAAELRALSAMAFAHAGRADALDVLAELLADPERAARAGAAQALGDTGRPDATALLRFKVRIGDEEAEVISACLGSLLALAPAGSLPFVARLLGGADDRAQAAALALGESRLAAAVPLLVEWCERVPADVRGRVGYLALALLRREEAIVTLLEKVRHGEKVDSAAAARALSTFREDRALLARLEEAQAGR